MRTRCTDFWRTADGNALITVWMTSTGWCAIRFNPKGRFTPHAFAGTLITFTFFDDPYPEDALIKRFFMANEAHSEDISKETDSGIISPITAQCERNCCDDNGAVGKRCQHTIYGCEFHHATAYIVIGQPFPDNPCFQPMELAAGKAERGKM